MSYLLISGTPGSGKCKLLEKIVKEFEYVIWITTFSSAEFVRKKLKRDDVWIVDTFTWGRKERTFEKDVVVTNPLNLNEVSLAVAKVLDKINDNYLLVMNSISGLLIYHSYQRLMHFLRTILVRIETDNSLGIFTIVKDAHDKNTEISISMFFPNIIELESKRIKIIKSSIPLEKNVFDFVNAKDIIMKMFES
ncbi:hypothetical protein B6U96_10105 [Archaeoglobales archaeon ex4484_92]|nr:MAG: hypothetical protein B6U96_10105 [Archaeoglobales archaeon ex4484_92]